MIPLRTRVVLGLLLVAVATVVYWVIDSSLAVALANPAPVSGWTLFSLVLLLTFFNARKKLPFLPLLSASLWLQAHVYLGLFSLVLFFFHIGFRVPHGPLEVTLAALFIAVNLSGIVGLGLSRWLPTHLTVHGENILFERIPAFRHQVREEVEKLVAESLARTDSATISDFYSARLRAFFERPRHLARHLLAPRKPLHRLLQEVAALDRYLNAEERTIMAQITELIRVKDNLDFQLAGQGVLKGWLFVHIPLTYALIVAGFVHALMAGRFT